MHRTPDTMLENARKILEKNRQVLADGGNPDVDAFDTQAKEICAVLASLPPLEAKKYEHILTELIASLSEFRDDLLTQKGNLEQRITMIHEHNRANTAYSNAMFIALQTAGNEE